MLNKIRQKGILQIVLLFLSEGKRLNLIKYNKKLQKRMELSFDDYKKYNQIVIEIIPIEKLDEKEEKNKFINRIEDNSLYHIYFNELNEEIHRYHIKKDEKIKKITIVIDMEVTSLKELFWECESIKEIKIIKCNRKNIVDMSYMFSWCTNLVKLDISKLRTDNTIDMNNMFRVCNKLEELDLSNFKTDNVKNMRSMFYACDSLIRINLSNFNTINVEIMNLMFYFCSKIKELDLSNFNTERVKDMDLMFYGCESLEKLNITSFRINESCTMESMFQKCKSLNELDISNFHFSYPQNDIKSMFYECSPKLKKNIKNQKPDIDEKAFQNPYPHLLKHH